MYGSACNQTQLVLQAIQDTKVTSVLDYQTFQVATLTDRVVLQVNMTVWLGAYVGDNSTVNAEQQQWVLDALQIYGTDHVSGVTIGNECALFLGLSFLDDPSR